MEFMRFLPKRVYRFLYKMFRVSLIHICDCSRPCLNGVKKPSGNPGLMDMLPQVRAGEWLLQIRQNQIQL